MGYLDDIFALHQQELDRREQNLRYRHDPAAWALDKLGIHIWYKQAELFDSIINCKNTSVRAGHGVGKSFSAALLTCWWVDVHPLGDAFVATTAPSADQVSTIIWREIKRFHLLSRKRAAELDRPDLALPGRVTEDNKWKIDVGGQQILVASGRKPPDNKSEDAFQGIHANYVLAIGDEAAGLSESLIDGLANITSNATSRRLIIGNPTDPRSYFAKIHKENEGIKDGAWNCIGISVMDSPNFHGGGLCACHPDTTKGLGMPQNALMSLSDQSYVDDKRKEYGEDSARYISRVLGRFAFEAGNNLFSDYDLAQAENTHVLPDPEHPYRILGVDVARMGQDFTVLYLAERGWVLETNDETGIPVGDLKRDENGNPIMGWKVRFLDKWQAPFVDQENEDGSVTLGSVTRIDQHARGLAVDEVRIDAAGMGHGVIDPLSATAKPYLIIEVLGNAASPDIKSYHNNRAFQYSEVRRKCFQGIIDLDPGDETMIDELGGIQYHFANQGGLQIESKESMKKRGVKSPDFADAVTYCLADLSHLLDDPLQGLPPGTLAVTDLDDFVAGDPMFQYSW